MDEHLKKLADDLWVSGHTRSPIAPLTATAQALGMATSVDNAYAIQGLNRERRLQGGERLVGRKIGLTARSVQQQLGVNTPDFGVLWGSSCFSDGETVDVRAFLQPKVEAEVALVLASDLDQPMASIADVVRATDCVLPAIEIVDSRIANWQIGLFDTVADNASGAAFVLGGEPKKLHAISLREARMRMTRGADVVSQGVGRDCLGHPLSAAVWLARTLSRRGDPLRAGDIVLTGALGPMVSVQAGQAFEAHIEGLGGVAVAFG